MRWAAAPQSSLNLHLAAASLLWRICEGSWKQQQAEGFDQGPLTSFCSLLLEVLIGFRV